jgi:hypothetical protein
MENKSFLAFENEKVLQLQLKMFSYKFSQNCNIQSIQRKTFTEMKKKSRFFASKLFA